MPPASMPAPSAPPASLPSAKPPLPPSAPVPSAPTSSPHAPPRQPSPTNSPACGAPGSSSPSPPSPVPSSKTPLRARGAHVERVDAYDTIPETLDPATIARVQAADAITFTSASTARFLRQALAETVLAPGVRLVSIGPATSAAVRAAFGRVDAEAPEPSIPALVGAVLEVLG